MFFSGDKVSYIGNRIRGLHGDRGFVCARVQNAHDEVVVDFDSGSYVVHITELSLFNPDLYKQKEKKEEKKDIKVEQLRKSKFAQDEDE